MNTNDKGRAAAGLTRRGLLGGALCALAGAAMADAPLRSLRPAARPGSAPPVLPPEARVTVARMIEEGRLDGPVGFVVADARTGRVLEEENPTLPLPPASVAKAVTALYALDVLGEGHRFDTRLIATGPVVNGVLQGDLVLAGGGDPTLDTDDLADLAASLAAIGLREVAGGFAVWAGALPYHYEIDPDQQDHLGYNPAVSGLNLNYNRVHFQWERAQGGYDVSMEARAARFTPEVSVARMRIVDRAVPVYTYSSLAGGVDDWTVARRALGTQGARWLPVRRPDLYAADVFRSLAGEAGIALKAASVLDAAPAGAVLAVHRSPPLRDMVRDMLKYSTNLTAEALGLAATAARGTRALGAVATPSVRVALQAASLRQSCLVMADWARTTLGVELDFVDHSGLGDASRISAAQMAALLVAAGPAGPLRDLMKTIPLTDESRAALDRPLGEVVAKTGTLNFVSALSGYLRTTAQADLVFAIFTAAPAAREIAKRSEDEIPAGARPWAGRSRRLQQRLMQRWAVVHAAPVPAAPPTLRQVLSLSAPPPAVVASQ